MGEFSSNLLAALAESQNTPKDKDVDALDLGTFANSTFSVDANKTIEAFKDALFLIVMMRARNYMVHNNQDTKNELARFAIVDISLQFDAEAVIHENQYKSGEKVARPKGIIPAVMPSIWDTKGDVNLQDFIERMSRQMALACR